MRILFVVGREPNYSRNKVILKALKEAGHTIIPCYSSHNSALVRFLVILFKFFFLRWKKHDMLYVGFFGQPLVPFLRIYDFDKPLLFDAFLSAYDTMVFDRKVAKQGSIKAWIFYSMDWISCRMSNVVLLDTQVHIDYFSKTFNLPKSKFERIFISADEEIFYPKDKKGKDFVVEFHGGFIPLQGTEFIIGAAKKLKDEKIKFVIIGDGQTFSDAKKQAEGLENVKFLGLRPAKDVSLAVSNCDVGLGIFGATQKAKRVIPNKAFEILAAKKALITANTPASRELLTHKKDAYLCKGADSDSLAKAILELKKDSRLRAKIASEGYRTFKSKASIKAISAQLKKITEEL